MRDLVRVAFAATTFALASVAGSIPLSACGVEDATTGKRIALDVEIAASPESRRFTNAAGWDITVTKALVATGALTYYDGATILARREPWSFVRPAHAHPGHYVPGNAKGEMLAASSADLLAGGVLGSGAGISGPVRSATFAFQAPAEGPFAGELGTNVVVLEATGTKGAETRAFRVEIAAKEVENAGGRTQIEGCPFLEADMQGDGTVSIAVNLMLWLDQVELDAVPEQADGSAVLLGDGLARNQIVRGVKVGVAYVFSYRARAQAGAG